MGCAQSRVAAQPLLPPSPNDALIAVVPASTNVNAIKRGCHRINKTVPEIMCSATNTKPPSDVLTTASDYPPLGRTFGVEQSAIQNTTYENLCMNLLKAVKNGDLETVERIVGVAKLEHDSQNIVDIRGMWESTPLIYACQYSHERLALWLLDAGADARLINEKGVTALLLASLEGMTTVVDEILKYLIRTVKESSVSLSETLDNQIGTVYNSVADVNVRATPLLAASMNGRLDIVKMLLAGGASVNLGVATTPVSTNGNTSMSVSYQFPLLYAAKFGHTKVANLLVTYGADLGVIDVNGNHALLLACEANKEECALELLRALPKDDLSSCIWMKPNRNGFTALHYTAIHGLVQLCELMLRELQWALNREFVNATSTTRNECALLMACRKRQLEVARVLIECKADILLADRGGTTALDLMKRERRDELIQLWEHIHINSDGIFAQCEPIGNCVGNTTVTSNQIAEAKIFDATNVVGSSLSSVQVHHQHASTITQPISGVNQLSSTKLRDTYLDLPPILPGHEQIIAPIVDQDAGTNHFLTYSVEKQRTMMLEPGLTVNYEVKNEGGIGNTDSSPSKKVRKKKHTSKRKARGHESTNEGDTSNMNETAPM